MKRKKPVILLSTYGGHKLGTGHIFRDLELANTLRSQAEVFFHVDGSNGAFEILYKCGLKYVFEGNLKKALEEFCPELVIYDRPYSLGKMEEIGQIKKPKIIALDYFYYDDSRVDAVINIKNHYLEGHSIKKIKKIYEGTEYAIVREEILKQRTKKSKLSRKVKNFLITFGGADPRNNTQKAIQILNRININKFNVGIILGHIFRKGLRYPLEKYFHNYVVSDKVLDMSSWMCWADMAFCGAGTTMMELLCIGCPAVVLPQNKEELDLAREMAGEKALLLLEPGFSMNSAKEKIEELICNSHLRKEIAQKGKKLFNGKGKERIKQIIFQELKGN